MKQGGSRRGLPKSFLNRFTQVHITCLNDEDLLHILTTQFPDLPQNMIEKMIAFNSTFLRELNKHMFGYRGGPWEYNLRDMMRWCQAVKYHYENSISIQKMYAPENFVTLIYSDRMRTYSDKCKVHEIFEHVFKKKIKGDGVIVYVTERDVIIGDIKLRREIDCCNVGVLKQKESRLVLRNQFNVLRSLAYCVNLNWLSVLVSFI